MKPVIFLDVDEVVNVTRDDRIALLHAKHPDKFSKYPKNSWSEWKEFTIGYAPIIYSPELVQNLNRISRKADIVWNTTWYHEAPKLFAPQVGLDCFPHRATKGMSSPYNALITAEQDPKYRWWKLNSILDDIEMHRRDFIWIDDDIDKQSQKVATDRATAHGLRSLIINPKPTVGLTPAHISTIDKFVDEI